MSAATQALYSGPERRSGRERRATYSRLRNTERRGQAQCSAATPHAAAYQGADGRMHVHGWYADFAEAKRQAGALKALYGNAGVFTSEEDGDA